MILDIEHRLSNAQAFSADAATTNTIDLGLTSPIRDIAAGEAMSMLVCVGVAADFTTGDETYEFQFIQSANADLSSPDVLASRIITAANLSLGSVHVLGIPPGAITKRYIGGFFNGGGTTPTITASVFLQPQSMASANFKAYARGYTITG